MRFLLIIEVEFSNDSPRAAVKSIRACELSEWLCVMALAVRGEIAVTGDMVPTIVFGFSIV